MTNAEKIVLYLEQRADDLESALVPGDMDPEHCYASRISQLRIEADNIRNGAWRTPSSTFIQQEGMTPP